MLDLNAPPSRAPHGIMPADATPLAPHAAPPVAAGTALVTLDAAGIVTFACERFRALACGPDGGSPVGRALHETCRATGLLERGRADADGAGSIEDAHGRAHPVAWTWTGPNGWVGVIALGGSGAEGSEDPALRTDALTGLPDRSSLEPALGALLARRGGTGAAIAAACIDLDRFKRVNDTLGHAAGDELLRKVARRLTASIRRTDVAIRMGGDEFTILFADCEAPAVEEMARRIIDVLARPFVVRGHQVVIGASVGLATLEPGERDATGLLRRADVALYGSKSAGRGRVSWFEADMLAALDKRRILETDLRRALLLDQLELAYQSQLGFETGRITGFEALIRWNHPVRGLVSPADFIPIAEETGEILKIGAWVLAEACRTARTWPDDLAVAVNVSSIQFEADGFVESVRAALAGSGLAPGRLELELTEAVLLTNDALVLDRMMTLRDEGVRMSLDDFGTGYSSLNYLRKYPFDKVKIDQSFVREPYADENAHRIVTAVAGLGAAMGISVIAEGVETEAQLDRIRAQGCTAAQGYLLSRPIPGAAIAAYLDATRAARPPIDATTPGEEKE